LLKNRHNILIFSSILYLVLIVGCTPHKEVKQKQTDPSSRVILTKTETNVFYDFAKPVMGINRFVSELVNISNSNEASMYIHGFYMGMDLEYNTELMGTIEKLDTKEFDEQLSLIVSTNIKVQTLIYNLDTYYTSIKNKDQSSTQTKSIHTLLEQLSPLLESNTSDTLCLYNITCNPRFFIKQKGYIEIMNNINEMIDEINKKMN
jgi:hypothetical protein